jgi:hypothetical protein
MFNKSKNNVTENNDLHIRTFSKDSSHNITLIVSNLLAISFLTYFVFFYMKNEVNLLSNTSVSHSQAVLGVSEVAEVSGTKTEQDNEYAVNTMEVTRYDKTIQSEPSYSEGIARELDDKSGFKGKVVVVRDELIAH